MTRDRFIATHSEISGLLGKKTARHLAEPGPVGERNEGSPVKSPLINPNKIGESCDSITQTGKTTKKLRDQRQTDSIHR